jgi:molybdopterin/thiamine biosynthesis adenylyltransferase
VEFNPAARVAVERRIMEDLPESAFVDHLTGKGGIIVACTDNREGALAANRISQHFGVPLVAVGFWERAAAGEIFYSLPGKTPCYRCMLRGEAAGGGGARLARRFYSDQEDLARIRFEPGISADISFVSAVAVKLILALLTPEEECDAKVPGRRRLLDRLTQYTLVCNDDDPRVGGERVGVFSRPLQITNSLTVGYDPDCPHCGGAPKGG